MSSDVLETDVKSSSFYKYHHATKHTVKSLYSSGYRLDWASQPNPFLHYDDAPLIDLPHSFEVSNSNLFETLALQDGDSQKTDSWNLQHLLVKPLPLDLRFISNLLFYGMSISAWKQVVGTDNRWALRVNASSGNLHPTDTNILIGEDVDGLPAGLYHYQVDKHKLEERRKGDVVTPLIDYLQLDCAPPPVVICLSSIFFREAWKYRDRAFRYCQHDMGHAIASLNVSAMTLGWDAKMVCLFPDDEVAKFLGMRSEPVTAVERPLALLLLNPKETAIERATHGVATERRFALSLPVPQPGTELPESGQFNGRANKLTSDLKIYDSIKSVYESTIYSFSEFCKARSKTKEFLEQENFAGSASGAVVLCDEPVPLVMDLLEAGKRSVHKSVHTTIRKRRSAVDMDGETGMTSDDLGVIMQSATMGFQADFLGSPKSRYFIQLYLYVHRVSGLASGLYLYDRSSNRLLPLLHADQKEVAMSTSCFQEIASDGAFSVSMVADFKTSFSLYGDRCYRLVHYEAGYIGQMLYLAACALGHDATGIGCFIDDAINNYLALDAGNEVIYNFTFGKTVHDPRLTTLSSYSFEDPANV